MEFLKKFPLTAYAVKIKSRSTEEGALFTKRMSFFIAVLALVFFIGAIFISCDEPKTAVTKANAVQPTITAQPANGFWNVFLGSNNTFELTVTVNVTDGGTLTYQWYSNTSNSASGGTPITTGGTNAALTLNKNDYNTNGARYFYVVVTNTNNNADGTKTASTTSLAAEVAVVGNPDTAYTTSALPENLKGTWIYEGEYPEIYIIDETTFDSGYYKGNIVGHRGNNNSGYITIEYTEAFNPASIGQHYVIHYKDLSISEMKLSGAYLGADPDFDWTEGTSGKSTQAEAEAVMTVSAGYFGMYSGLGKEDTKTPSVILPNDLKGTWESIWGEEYIIDATTFTSGYGGSVSYTGTIVAHNADGVDAGYITIQYTENSSYTNSTGKFYVIYYEDLTSSTMSVSGAYKGGDPDFNAATGGSGGKATQAEAEETYTVGSGYFGGGSNCYKFSGVSFSNKMEGEWAEEDYGMIVTITDSKIITAMDYMGIYTMTLFIGEIVEMQDNGVTGYIIFKYALIDAMSGIDDDAIGTYTVLYWENYSDGSADMAIGDSNWFGFDKGEISIAAAKSKYINGTYDFDDDLLEFEKQ